MKLTGFVSALLCAMAGLAASSNAAHAGNRNLDPSCSPGYWANHTEVWWEGSGSGCCEETYTGGCTLLLDNLTANGAGSNTLRRAAQDILDGCFAELPCEDYDNDKPDPDRPDPDGR